MQTPAMAEEARTPKDIGRRLVLLRHALNDPTSAAFAERVGITPQSMNNYERGVRRIELDKALQIVTRTGVTLDWIYRGEKSGLSTHLFSLLLEQETTEERTGS